MTRLYLLLLALLATPLLARAQPEIYNWHFGNRASLTFPGGGAPVLNPLTPCVAFEACSSISDKAGVLQCYTNSEQVWDRTNTPMPNGQLSGTHSSATQGALLVPAPQRLGRYYLFTVDAQENNFAGGLRCSTINMTLRGGLGDVELPSSVLVAGAGELTEKLAAVRHANGYDYWIIVHKLGVAEFNCYLLTSAGLSATPVVSQVGDGNTARKFFGCLRASPNGRLLASVYGGGLELFDFDNATGRLTLRRGIYGLATTYGLEFSADNTKLYASSGTVAQLDLTEANSALLLLGGAGSPGQNVGGLLRGPDGRIYGSMRPTTQLSIIESPNLAGAACNLRLNALSLGAAFCWQNLPNFPNSFAPIPTLSAPAVACVGAVVQVAVSPAWSTYSYSWSFGDGSPAVAGATASHTYAQAGTYTITLTGTPLAGGPALVQQQQLVVSGPPALSLGPRRQLGCAGGGLTLGPVGGALSGLSYQWRDGVAGPTRQVSQPGRYVLTATTVAGCRVRDSVEVELLPGLQLRLQAPAVLCPGLAAVELQGTPQPPGTTYRWQDGTATATYLARRPGRYRLTVQAPNGCLAADSVEVRLPAADGDCDALLLPTIITPNGDGANDYFELRGLYLPDWDIDIYNRWGRRVWQQAGYDNRWQATGVSAGIYYYLLVNRATGRRLKGWVEVVK